MRQTIFFVGSLLLASSWATGQPTNQDATLIHRVRTLTVSSLDRHLPNVTLDYFLSYEAAGAAIRWQVSECSKQNGSSGSLTGPNSRMCVEAKIDLKDRAAKVMVFVGTFKKHPVDVLTLDDVSVAYPYGGVHHLDHLSDLPVELHRPAPKGPKDLPAPGDMKSQG